MAVDWTKVKPKLGDLVCPNHGIITNPTSGVIAACPTCQRGLLTAVPDRKFGAAYQEGCPSRCAGADRHPLQPGKMLVGWHPCLCNPTGGHMWWRCKATDDCGDIQLHPPCISRDSGHVEPGRSPHNKRAH